MFCLIHDDIMDRSDRRRGCPTVHRALTERHRTTGSAATWLGTSVAILAGDLALAWSDELLHTASHNPAVRRVVDLMREEVICGQHLDLLAPHAPNPTSTQS